MGRKKPVPAAMESSDDGETGSESSGYDEFDSQDERQVPAKTLNQVPSETLALTTQEENSACAESSDESEEEPIKLAVKLAGSEATQPPTQQINGRSEKPEAVKSFDSDLESEYDSESSSESEDLVQKSVPSQNRKDMVIGNAIKAVESLPLGQKQAQKDEKKGKGEDDHSAKKGKAEDGQSAKKGKAEVLKQQQKGPPPATNGENEGLNQVQKEDHPAKKGHGEALKQVRKDDPKDDSMKKEKKEDRPSKKGKVESLKRNKEDDSDDKEPARKRKKESAAAESEQNHEKSRSTVASKDAHIDKTGLEKAMSTQNGDRKASDRDKPAHADSHDADKEIARKARSDPTARAIGSGNGLHRKVSKAENEGKHEKKAHNLAVKEPPSPQKQKKLPHVWSPDEKIVMASEVLNCVKLGMEIPSKRNDDFWVKLSETLQHKLDIEFSKDQLCDMLKRMKQRYQTMVQKVKESQDMHKPYKHKNPSDQSLFDIWSQIWGRAEVNSLDDEEEAGAAKPISKKDLDVIKSRPSPKAKVSEEDEGSDVDESVGREGSDVNRFTTMPMELDKKEVSTQGDGMRKALSNTMQLPILAGCRTPADGKFNHFSSDMHKFLQDEIRASLHELQEWSKQSVEEWVSKAMTLVENAVRTLADQSRHMNGMGLGPMAAGGLPFRSWDLIDFQLSHGEQALQQQWYELQLQELNIYAQKLQLMQKECKVKQEQLKLQLQLQLERGKQS